MTYGRNRIATLLGSTAILFASVGHANSQSAPAPAVDNGGIEVVTVTARKVSENEQNVPISMTAITGAQLNVGRQSTLESLNNSAPNLQVFRNVDTENNYIVYIRGQGRNNGLFNIEPEVALYVDDVYYPYQFGPVLDLDDVDHVEVLRGPQGTLYGRNATVGAIKYQTQRPDLTTEQAFVDFTAGSFGREDGQGGISMPLIDNTVAAKVDFGVHNYDGFMTDVLTGKKIGGDHSFDGRGEVLWQVASNAQILFEVDGQHADDPLEINTPIVVKNGKVLPYWGSWHLTESTNVMPQANNIDVAGGMMEATVDLGDMTLKSITSYRYLSQAETQDSKGRDDLAQNGSEYFQTARTFTQEFQATGSLLDDRLSYAGGVFYLNSQDTPDAFQQYKPAAWTTEEATKSIAVYLNGTYKILDNWDVSAGIRGSWDTKSIGHQTETSPTVNYVAGHASDSWSAATYTISSDYHITDSIMAYVSYGTGYKSGQVVSIQNTNPVQADTFAPPETDRDLEGGFKTQWLDDRLLINVDYYYIPYKNLTTALLNPSTGEQYLAAVDARMQGPELEIDTRPTPAWNLSGTLGTIFSEYVNTVPGGVGYHLADESLQHAPKVSARLWTDYTFDDLPMIQGSLKLGADFQYTSKTYEEATHALYTTQGDYEVVGFYANYIFPNPRYELIFQGTNVTDTHYFLLGSLNMTQFTAPPAEFSLTFKYRM